MTAPTACSSITRKAGTCRKWVDGVFGDEDLSMALAAIESRLGDHEIPVDEARSQFMAVVRAAYPM
jgi:hypothetical protein